MSDKICFVSVAFGDERYKAQQVRLIESIDKFQPDSVGFHWTDHLPPGAQPFLNSLYGFKVHAVLHALNEGYNKIMFLDPACYLTGPVDFYFDLCKSHGVIAIRDDNRLEASNSALEHFGYTRDEIKGLHLVGGSLYAFHFPHSRKVFDLWYRAERSGIFGSQYEAASEKLQGHRYDETCMALSLHRCGFEPVAADVGSYNFESAIIRKSHFK
jgi:hypothetical protein